MQLGLSLHPSCSHVRQPDVRGLLSQNRTSRFPRKNCSRGSVLRFPLALPMVERIIPRAHGSLFFRLALSGSLPLKKLMPIKGMDFTPTLDPAYARSILLLFLIMPGWMAAGPRRQRLVCSKCPGCAWARQFPETSSARARRTCLMSRIAAPSLSAKALTEGCEPDAPHSSRSGRQPTSKTRRWWLGPCRD